MNGTRTGFISVKDLELNGVLWFLYNCTKEEAEAGAFAPAKKDEPHFTIPSDHLVVEKDEEAPDERRYRAGFAIRNLDDLKSADILSEVHAKALPAHPALDGCNIEQVAALIAADVRPILTPSSPAELAMYDTRTVLLEPKYLQGFAFHLTTVPPKRENVPCSIRLNTERYGASPYFFLATHGPDASICRKAGIHTVFLHPNAQSALNDGVRFLSCVSFHSTCAEFYGKDEINRSMASFMLGKYEDGQWSPRLW